MVSYAHTDVGRLNMKKMDALYKYWEDPRYIVVEAGQPELIIKWLSKQTPDTWHRVVTTWNYDHENKILSWVLQQENCDKGTAANVFCIEGLADDYLARNDSHLCSTILDNWERYSSGELYHQPKNSEDQKMLIERVQKYVASGLYPEKPILDVARYSGSRAATSKFESEDGKIVVAFDHWIKINGIEISD